MNKFYEKLREATEKWVGTLCPKIRQKVRKNTYYVANCTTIPAPVQGMGVFEVTSNQRTYIVELNMRSCTCRRWKLTGLPCREPKVGRPKRSRKKNPEELADGTKLSKHGVKMHCGYCRDRNHKKRNCGKYKANVAREQGVEEEDEVVQQPATGQDEEVQQSATVQDEVVQQQGRKRTRKEQDHVEAADQPKKQEGQENLVSKFESNKRRQRRMRN
jgi:hypothetical protein